jgi:hypothetical protein
VKLRKSLIGALVGVAVLAVAGVAAAGTQNGVTFETKYSATTVGALTGFTTTIEGAPRDASGNVEGAERVIVNFQRGTAFDTDVPGKCSVETLRAEGRNGCPANSIVGTGTAQAVTGLTSIDPVNLNITAFNKAGGIIFYLQGTTVPVTLPLEGTLRGSRLTVDIPRINAIPGSSRPVAVTAFNLKIKRVRRGRNAYVKTPRTCRGRWTVRATFQYPTAADITNIASRTRCKRPRSRR